MKYKIQTEGAFGWGDLKSSLDGKPYETEFYSTREEAQKELDSICNEFGDVIRDEYRIVTEDVVEDFDIYVE